MKTFLGARKAVLNEVHFPADLGEAPRLRDRHQRGDRQAIDEFLGTGDAGRAPGANEEPTAPPQEPGPGATAAEERKRTSRRRSRSRSRNPNPTGRRWIDATGQSEPFANQISKVKTGDGGHLMVKFPIFYPTRLAPGSIDSNDSRAFPIDGPRSTAATSSWSPSPGPSTGLTTEYYGVSGTELDDPPILENPSETREIDGHEYQLFYDGDRLRLVGFKATRRSYWVSNTLLQSLDEDEMLSIATSMRRFKG